MLQVYRVSPPAGYDSDDAAAITNEELGDALDPLSVREVWFWYWMGGYEGSGQALMRNDYGWDVINLSHCSCYDPLDTVSFHPHTPEGLRAKYSAEAWKEIAPLAAAAMPGVAP